MHWCTPSKFSSVTWGDKEYRLAETTTKHSSIRKSLHCFAFLPLSFVLSWDHTPSHAHNQHTRQDEGSQSNSRTDILLYSKAITISRSSASTSHPCRGFFPDKEADKYSPFSRSPDKTTLLLGTHPALGSSPCPFFPSFFTCHTEWVTKAFSRCPH